MVSRLLLLLGLLGGLALLIRFNSAPIQLTFLGMQTAALPLAVWILAAIAAGALTHLLIGALFRMSNFATAREVRALFRRAARRGSFQSPSQTRFSSEPTRAATTQTLDNAEDDAWKNWEGYEEVRQPAAQKPPKQDPVDDWEADPIDDWEDEPVDAPRDTKRASTPLQPPRDYEAKQEPKTTSRSGSVYSYGYRDPGKSGVGKAEPVVDADYRVIVPPYRSLEEPPTADDGDDWFEDDDDEFRDGDERQRWRS